MVTDYTTRKRRDPFRQSRPALSSDGGELNIREQLKHVPNGSGVVLKSFARSCVIFLPASYGYQTLCNFEFCAWSCAVVHTSYVQLFAVYSLCAVQCTVHILCTGVGDSSSEPVLCTYLRVRLTVIQ